MKYIKRILWLLLYLPTFVMAMVTLIVGIVLCPIVYCVYYIKDGSVDNCDMTVDTMPQIIHNIYIRLKPKE